MKTKIIFIFLMTLVVLVGGTFVYIEAFNAAKDDLTSYSDEAGNVIIVPSVKQKGASFKQSKRNSTVKTYNDITVQTAGPELSQATGPESDGIHSTARGAKSMYLNRQTDKRIVSSGGSGANMLIAARSGRSSSSGGSSGSGSPQGINTSAGGGTILAPFGAPSTELNRPTGQPPVTLPPPEGVPVGDGLWILMLLALGYMFYIRRK